MTTPMTRRLTRFQYAATLFGALAFVALAPAGIAHATDNLPISLDGCTYTDSGGYQIPIDDGQTISTDGKIASCHGGSIAETRPPKRGVGNLLPQLDDRNVEVPTQTP